MAAILWSDVVTLDASLTATPVPLQAVLLLLVHEMINPATFGGEESQRTKMARSLLAAHFAKLFGQIAGGEVVGPVTSRSMGGISKSMAAAAMTPEGLTRTGHGQAYQFLVSTASRAQGFRA